MLLKLEQVGKCIEAVCKLPPLEQACCAFIAAEMSLPAWQRLCRSRETGDASVSFIHCFKRWLGHEASADELREAASRFDASIPADLRAERDPSGGMAGRALKDVAVIALAQGGDVRDDTLARVVSYAAAAHCNIPLAPVTVPPRIMTKCELEFISVWWRRCRHQFSRLKQWNG